MKDAFIIMQIGNKELDSIYNHYIVPAIKACGLSPKRVDKHNQGGLLKSEIIKYIETSEIIIADLTNERPNCYLEIGYAMGMDKFRNLILTSREDHNYESVNYIKGGPKIHFDLSGYDILFWDSTKLEDFRLDLEKKIKRRLAIIQPSPESTNKYWDDEWINSHQKVALEDIKKIGVTGFMEARFALDIPKPSWTQKELSEAARASTIHKFGWPIAIYIDNNDKFRPKPTADGIVAEVVSSSYDYWTLRKNGDFFMLKSLFEDSHDTSKIYFDTRIIRVTELFLYCARLYDRLGVDRSLKVNIIVRHGGLKNRVINRANSKYIFFEDRSTTEDESTSEIRIKIEEIETNLTSLVKQVLAPMFMLFDYLEFQDEVYENIVTDFIQ